MNTALKIGAAGALTLAGVAAHASIPSPSLSSSDAVLFGEVLNAAGTSIVASYAGDTGLTINQLTSTGYKGTVLGSDTNLTALFTADTGSDVLVWAVQAAQNTTSSTASQFLTTTTSVSKLTGQKDGNLATWESGFQADISTINSNITSGNSVEGANPATAGVWDITASGGTSSWYGTNPTQQTLGTIASLYSEVANNAAASSTKGVTTLLGTVSLSSAGLAVNVGSPVPLPAAVWLLGSGLLGLTGVARRRSKA
jgi:hypothetical protein